MEFYTQVDPRAVGEVTCACEKRPGNREPEVPINTALQFELPFRLEIRAA